MPKERRQPEGNLLGGQKALSHTWICILGKGVPILRVTERYRDPSSPPQLHAGSKQHPFLRSGGVPSRARAPQTMPIVSAELQQLSKDRGERTPTPPPGGTGLG